MLRKLRRTLSQKADRVIRALAAAIVA